MMPKMQKQHCLTLGKNIYLIKLGIIAKLTNPKHLMVSQTDLMVLQTA